MLFCPTKGFQVSGIRPLHWELPWSLANTVSEERIEAVKWTCQASPFLRTTYASDIDDMIALLTSAPFRDEQI